MKAYFVERIAGDKNTGGRMKGDHCIMDRKQSMRQKSSLRPERPEHDSEKLKISLGSRKLTKLCVCY